MMHMNNAWQNGPVVMITKNHGCDQQGQRVTSATDGQYDRTGLLTITGQTETSPDPMDRGMSSCRQWHERIIMRLVDLINHGLMLARSCSGRGKPCILPLHSLRWLDLRTFLQQTGDGIGTGIDGQGRGRTMIPALSDTSEGQAA